MKKKQPDPHLLRLIQEAMPSVKVALTPQAVITRLEDIKDLMRSKLGKYGTSEEMRGLQAQAVRVYLAAMGEGLAPKMTPPPERDDLIAKWQWFAEQMAGPLVPGPPEVVAQEDGPDRILLRVGIHPDSPDRLLYGIPDRGEDAWIEHGIALVGAFVATIDNVERRHETEADNFPALTEDQATAIRNLDSAGHSLKIADLFKDNRDPKTCTAVAKSLEKLKLIHRIGRGRSGVALTAAGKKIAASLRPEQSS